MRNGGDTICISVVNVAPPGARTYLFTPSDPSWINNRGNKRDRTRATYDHPSQLYGMLSNIDNLTSPSSISADEQFPVRTLPDRADFYILPHSLDTASISIDSLLPEE